MEQIRVCDYDITNVRETRDLQNGETVITLTFQCDCRVSGRWTSEEVEKAVDEVCATNGEGVRDKMTEAFTCFMQKVKGKLEEMGD